MTKPKPSELWKLADSLLDAVLVVNKNCQIYFANDSFRGLCDLPNHAVRSHADVTTYIELPEECWVLIRAGEHSAFDFGLYREVDFSSKRGSGRAQIIVDKIRDPGLAEEELFFVILRDVTLESRLHEKYKSQISSNEKLIEELERNLAQTAFLRGLAQDLPMYADTSSLLTVICRRMKVELGFREANFFSLSEKGSLTPLGVDPRVGSRMRDIMRALEARMAEADSQGSVASLLFEPFGTFWVVRMSPKIEHSLILVASSKSAITGVDLKSLFVTLRSQVCTLLDNRSLYTASITDQLTGLFNRRFFDSRLLAECLNAKEASNPLALIMLDVDHFKNVNDVYGHPAGDAVLKEMGKLIRSRIRDEDIGARVGGEEFAILLPGTNPKDALIVANQVREMVEKLVVDVPGQGELRVTISCGIAGYPWPCLTSEDLYEAADTALYQAKESGRNQCIINEVAVKRAAGAE